MPTKCWRTSNWCDRVRGSGKRSPKSRTRGRQGTPAEVVMRLLLLKHIRNWSYECWSAKSGNLVYRDFTRGDRKRRMQNHGPLGIGAGPEGRKDS